MTSPDPDWRPSEFPGQLLLTAHALEKDGMNLSHQTLGDWQGFNGFECVPRGREIALDLRYIFRLGDSVDGLRLKKV